MLTLELLWDIPVERSNRTVGMDGSGVQASSLYLRNKIEYQEFSRGVEATEVEGMQGGEKRGGEGKGGERRGRRVLIFFLRPPSPQGILMSSQGRKALLEGTMVGTSHVCRGIEGLQNSFAYNFFY